MGCISSSGRLMMAEKDYSYTRLKKSRMRSEDAKCEVQSA